MSSGCTVCRWITMNTAASRHGILFLLILHMHNAMGKVCVSCGGGIAEPKKSEIEDEKCENCTPAEEAAE